MINQFYIKVAYETKIKKYLVTRGDKIDFKQIHCHLGIGNNWRDYIFFYQIVDDFSSNGQKQKAQLTQQDIIAYIHQNPAHSGSTLKLRIIQRQLMSEEEKRRKQSQESFQVPETVEKKRSKSVELDSNLFDQTCRTEVFQVEKEMVMSPKNLNVQRNDRSLEFGDLSNSQNNLTKKQQARKSYLTKSTQVSCSQNLQNSNTLSNENMLGSFTKSFQFKKIQNCLHQSIRITERQKTELQKLKNRIKFRQKQLQRTQSTIIDAKQMLNVLDLQY